MEKHKIGNGYKSNDIPMDHGKIVEKKSKENEEKIIKIKIKL